MKSKILLTTIKNIFVSCAICITLSSCGVSEEALETKKLLDKLQTKTEVGINKKEYSNAVADLKYAFRQINNEKEKEDFERIIKIHETTYIFWDKCYSYKYPYNCPTDNPTVKLLFATFPELEKKASLDNKSSKRFNLHTDSVIQELWAMANSELETIKH